MFVDFSFAFRSIRLYYLSLRDVLHHPYTIFSISLPLIHFTILYIVENLVCQIMLNLGTVKVYQFCIYLFYFLPSTSSFWGFP